MKMYKIVYKTEFTYTAEEFNLKTEEESVDFSNGKYDEKDWDDWVNLIEESFEKLVD